jgi:hypothetical protein
MRCRKLSVDERRRAMLTAKDFRTTLLLAVLRPPWLAVAQVGDGLVVMQRGGAECLLLDRSRPMAENANMVAYLCQRDFPADITVCFVPGITGLAVATDGLEDCVHRSRGRRARQRANAATAQIASAESRD